MQHFLKTTLAVGAFAMTMGFAHAQDLAPLNSDSGQDRMDWFELEAKFGPQPAPPAGTKVSGVSKTLTKEYWRSLGEGYANVATARGIEFVFQAAPSQASAPPVSPKLSRRLAQSKSWPRFLPTGAVKKRSTRRRRSCSSILI